MKTFTLVLLILLLNACGGGSDTKTPPKAKLKITPKTSWHWQLQGKIDTKINAKVYDIDLFDTPISTIKTLKGQGKIIICYFSAGSYENWRSDAKEFPKEALGNNLDGWEGEKWLDIRDSRVLGIMKKRLDLAKDKGCDGVEPDNVDGYGNDTGFDIGYGDQLNYNINLSKEAHKRGLLIALKNDLEQIDELVKDFDFAINEQCHEFDECDYMTPFIEANKAVFNAEYNSKYSNEKNFKKLCQDSNKRAFSTMYLPLELDNSFRKSCQ